MMLQNIGHITGWIAVMIVIAFSFRVGVEGAEDDDPVDDDAEDDPDDDAVDDYAVDDDAEDDPDDGPATGLEDDEETQEEVPATAAPAPGAVPAAGSTAGTVKPAPPKVSAYLTADDRAAIRNWREQGMDEDDIQVAIAETVATRREAAREASEFYIEVERRENPAMIDELRPYIRRALARYTPDVASTQAGVNQAIAQALLDSCAVEGAEHKPISSVIAKYIKGAKPAASKPRTAAPISTRVPTNTQSGSGARPSASRSTGGKMKELYD